MKKTLEVSLTKEMTELLREILQKFQDDAVSRDDFCDLMGDRFEARIERVLSKVGP